ncbi:MAG: PocR ligand-binding domain-containing protein [Planctomycetes bacterium]|nr:PocR ligand-binding domain-containing protein [Planctomycetota bacterium]
MQRPDIMDIGGDLAAVSRLAGVPVLWRCAVSSEPWRLIPEERIHHCNPCCMAVKADPRRWGRCRVVESTDLEAACAARRGPWLKRCHAGLVELVVPVMADGRYLGALLAGPWQDASGCPYADAEASWSRLPAFDERRSVDVQRVLSLLALRLASLSASRPAVDARVQRALDRHNQQALRVFADYVRCYVEGLQLEGGGQAASGDGLPLSGLELPAGPAPGGVAG